MNPLDEFLATKHGSRIEKTADWQNISNAFRGAAQDVPNTFAHALIGGAALGVAGGALTGAAAGVNALWNAATKSRDFRGMLEANPHLKEHHDQKAINRAFTSLRTFAPDLSKDPLVAGSYVSNMMESPMGAAGIMQEALRGQHMIPGDVGEGARSAVLKGMRPHDENMQARLKDLEHTLGSRREQLKGQLNMDVENLRARNAHTSAMTLMRNKRQLDLSTDPDKLRARPGIGPGFNPTTAWELDPKNEEAARRAGRF